MTDSPSPAADSRDLEELVQRCLEALEADGPGAVEEVLAGRKDSERQRVRAMLDRLDDLGMVEHLPEARPAIERLGEFQLLRELGSGGMGVVYLARQQSVDRLVALKVVRTPAAAGSGSTHAERFRREAQAIAKLRHPHIVTVHGAGEDGGVSYLAMELVPGRGLDEVVHDCQREGAPPAVLDVVRWGRELGSALACAHEAGIVHRDVKPSNVRIADDGRAVLLDFGLARDVASTALTLTGSFQGSPHFASPEQVAAGRRDIGPPSDVFSLGATLYACLTGVVPFDGETAEQIFHQILAVDPVPLRRLNPRVPRELEIVIGKAMEKEPARRYGSALALASDLDAVLEGRPIRAQPPGVALRLWKWTRRHPAAAVALVSVAGLILTLAVGLWIALGLLADTRRARAKSELTLAVRDAGTLPGEVDDLWPAVPERVTGPRGMDAWLQRARVLLDALARYERQLEELRASALPDTEERQAGRQRLLERARQFADFRERNQEIDSLGIETLFAWHRQREQELRADAEWRFPIRFENAELAERHAALRELVRGIPPLAPLVETVEARRRFALDVDRRTIDDHRAAWERACAAVASDPVYRGLALAPQRGLVPLGRDPSSGLFEFGHLLSGRPPERGADGALQIADDTGLVLVLLPGGACRMGSVPPNDEFAVGEPYVDPQCIADWETPVNEVELEPFFLSKYEMTQGQWLRITGANPSSYKAGTPHESRIVTLSHPVEQVSWHEARTWLRRLELALPTEAQWEYAARAGTTTPWWTGVDAASVAAAANVADASAKQHGGGNWKCEAWSDGHVIHAPVGSFRANAFGLHDVHGNVFEWCGDWFVSYQKRTTGPTARRSGFEFAYRVARSGPYNEPASTSRSARRTRFAPEFTYTGLGVRPSRPVRE